VESAKHAKTTMEVLLSKLDKPQTIDAEDTER
jgi:hypothetical protein